MAKYALFISITLLIVSIILFSSFIKEDPSYIGIAKTVSKETKKSNDAANKSFIRDHGKSNIPEMAPIVTINHEIPVPSSAVKIKEPLKKEAPKKEKKKKELIVIPDNEVIPLISSDTFVTSNLSTPDTLSPKITNEQIQEQTQVKKKKKKFLFFKRGAE